jgi:hypothetical protein
MLDSLALQRTVLNGIILSLALGVIVMGSMMYNARLWLQDYPKPIRDKVPPLSPKEKRDRAVLTVLVMGVLLGMVILEIFQLRTGPAGTISYGAAFLHFFLMLSIFNLFDALVLDLFILTLLKPKFAILPGAEGMEYLFNDYRKQLTDFLKGVVFCTVASLPLAGIVVL